eukprot:2590559-Amphidinium_carterae.1
MTAATASGASGSASLTLRCRGGRHAATTHGAPATRCRRGYPPSAAGTTTSAGTTATIYT